MIWGTTEQLNTWRAMINEMSQFQLIVALTMILNGADVPYAIDHAYAMGTRNHNKKSMGGDNGDKLR